MPEGQEAAVGCTLQEVAEENGVTPIQQAIDFALEPGTPRMRSGVRYRGLAGSAEDVERYTWQDFAATSTDAGVVLNPGPGRN